MRCPQSRGSLTKIVIFGTKHFVRYSRHILYLGCPLLASFTLNESVRKILAETYEDEPEALKLLLRTSYFFFENFFVLNILVSEIP